MKIPALLTALFTVLALGGGAAFAQGTSEPAGPQAATTTDQGIARGNRVDGTLAKTRSDGKMMGNSAATAKNSGASQPTTQAMSQPMSQPMASNDAMTDKAKSGTHKAAHASKPGTHKAKHVAKRSTHKAAHVAMNDARRMGAAGSNLNSHDRQARMDAAYDDWKSRQK